MIMDEFTWTAKCCQPGNYQNTCMLNVLIFHILQIILAVRIYAAYKIIMQLRSGNPHGTIKDSKVVIWL